MQVMTLFVPGRLIDDLSGGFRSTLTVSGLDENSPPIPTGSLLRLEDLSCRRMFLRVRFVELWTTCAALHPGCALLEVEPPSEDEIVLAKIQIDISRPMPTIFS